MFIDSLRFCKQLKGFELYAFSIIYDHINLIIKPGSNFNISQIVKSLKENVSRDINVVMGYTAVNLGAFVGETSKFRQQIRRILGLYRSNTPGNMQFKKFDILLYKNRFIKKYENLNPYPKFRWKFSFFDHYIRFHDNHLKRQKDWDYHYDYTVYNHLKHGLPESWKYTSLNYPEMIDYIDAD